MWADTLTRCLLGYVGTLRRRLLAYVGGHVNKALVGVCGHVKKVFVGICGHVSKALVGICGHVKKALERAAALARRGYIVPHQHGVSECVHTSSATAHEALTEGGTLMSPFCSTGHSFCSLDAARPQSAGLLYG